jgi:hypothetical protein
MPKVVSRAAISSSDQAVVTASAQAVLRSFYCLCGEFILVIDRGLDKLPRRRWVRTRRRQGTEELIVGAAWTERTTPISFV